MATTLINSAGESFSMDATVELAVSAGAQTSDHPVENGSTVSDHIIRVPSRYVLRGIVTESPFATSVNLTTGAERVTAAIDFIEAAVAQGDLLSLVSDRLGVVPNLVPVRWDHRFTARLGAQLEVHLKQLLLSEAGFVEIPPGIASTPVADVGMPDEQDAGDQATESTAEPDGTDPPQTVEDKSVLAGLLGL